jgi:hypothetical protein
VALGQKKTLTRRGRCLGLPGGTPDGAAIGEGLNASYDKEMVKRLDELENLPEEQKSKIFEYIDLVIRDYKAKVAYA